MSSRSRTGEMVDGVEAAGLMGATGRGVPESRVEIEVFGRGGASP
jgi:hypothetical protein